jgi:hypothetical protein
MFELILAVNNVLIQESYKRSFAEKLWFPFETVDLQFKKYVQWAGKIFIQQQRRNEEKTESKYQLDREKLFISLFHNWFINSQLKEESEFISDLTKFANEVARVDADWLLSHTLNNTCSDEEKSTLDEFQLRREKELSELSDEKAKRQVIIIITTITPVIQELFKLATKSKNLTDEEKKQLIVLKWKLGKR